MMEHDVIYVPQKAIAMTDFLVGHPVLDDSPLVTDLPNEDIFAVDVEAIWELYFDGASHTKYESDKTPRKRAGVGIVFKTPHGETMYHSFSLCKE